jgi:hypothetical protein
MADAKPVNGRLKSLQIIHKAMMAGVIILTVLLVLLISSNHLTALLPQYNQPLQLVVLAMAAAGFFIGNSIVKKAIAKVRKDGLDINNKWMIYRQACLIQWALLEAPAILALVFFLLTGNYAFVALAVTLILVMGLTAPTKLKVAMLLQLSQAEIDEL